MSKLPKRTREQDIIEVQNITINFRFSIELIKNKTLIYAIKLFILDRLGVINI